MSELHNAEWLRESGLLWYINRTVFHPRGYALAIVLDDEDGSLVGFELLGDGVEPWNFPDGEENEYLAKVKETLP